VIRSIFTDRAGRLMKSVSWWHPAAGRTARAAPSFFFPSIVARRRRYRPHPVTGRVDRLRNLTLLPLHHLRSSHQYGCSDYSICSSSKNLELLEIDYFYKQIFGNITTFWAIFAILSLHMRRTAICALPIQILAPPLNSSTSISYKTGLFL